MTTRPDDDERGLAGREIDDESRGLGADARGLASPAETVRASAGELSRNAASESLDGLVAIAVQAMNQDPDGYKVLLNAALIAERRGQLRDLIFALAGLPHAQFGDYFALMMVILETRGSSEIADLVADRIERAGVQLGKLVQQPPGADGSTPSAIGLARTMNARTMVRLGKSPFYVSFHPPPGDFSPPGGPTSLLYVYDSLDLKRMYRLDYGFFEPVQGDDWMYGWHHNFQGENRHRNWILRVTAMTEVKNHQPAGGWAKAGGLALRGFRFCGQLVFLANAIDDVITVHYAVDKRREGLAAISSLLAGAMAAPVGARAGAVLWNVLRSAAFRGVLGARAGLPGAVVGVILGGALAGVAAAAIARAATKWSYDCFLLPLDAERWFVLSDREVELTGK